MNKLGKTHITAINMSFHQNVFLLTQVVPPSLEFQQHFKKGMFDKSNVAGFLHVSHYLSIIYDAKLFKQMVKWPLSCKKDEITYRNEMKNFFFALSQDNPDINFPLILTSHLILSGGTKFLIIMWKLSQLTLRTYIKRELQKELLNAPHTSQVNDLTVMYFKNIIAEKYNSARSTYKETEDILNTANNFLKNENILSHTYKSEIFDRKENLKKLVCDKSVHPLVQERLMDVEDFHIIEFWKKHILKNLQFTHIQVNELNKIREICSRLRKLIFGINSYSEVLNANSFPKINSDNCLLRTQNLYVDGSITFSTLLSLITLACPQMLQCMNLDSIVSWSNLSQCLLCVQNACRNIKCLQALFMALDVRLNGMLADERVFRQISNVPADLVKDSTFITKRHILLQSPKINFSFDQCKDDLFYEELCPSLIENKHDHLFKKYKYKYPLHERSTASSLLNDSFCNNISGWLSPRAHSTKYEQVTFKGKPISSIYAKLLHCPKLSSKRPRENILYSPSYEEQNSSKRRHTISGYLTMNTHGGKPRSHFNSVISPLCVC